MTAMSRAWATDEPSYWRLPVGENLAKLDDLMRFELFGIGLMRFGTLEKHGLISHECHRLVLAALLVHLRMTAGRAQALIGDHLYAIGPPDGAVVKIGRSQDLDARLRDLSRGSPVRLVVRHVEPGLGRWEVPVHKVLDSCRLHGEWFDFGEKDPGKAVREALLSLEELTWLQGLAAARSDVAAEMIANAGRPVRAQAMLHEANRVYEEKKQAVLDARRVEKERHEKAVPAADYDGRRQRAAAALWSALERSRAHSD